MSKRIGNVIIIAPEEDDKCELCGKVDELRPYGPNGERICYDCGMANLETTQYMMGVKLFGDLPDESRRVLHNKIIGERCRVA